MTDNEYYNLDRYSFSYLSGFKQENRGGKPSVKTSDFIYSFGTLFHLAALEPQKFATTAHEIKRDAFNTMSSMLASLDKSQMMQYLRNHPSYEVEKITLFDFQGQPFKMKTDIEITDLIVDLKTTRMKSTVQFAEELAEKDSWMQASLYMHATGKRSFLFIGVQSFPPYQLYFVHSHENKLELIAGLNQARQLTDLVSMKPQPIPSTQ